MASHAVSLRSHRDWNLGCDLNGLEGLRGHVCPRSELLKKNNDILLTLKAYNGRCALEWLAVRLREAAQVQGFKAADETLEVQAVALNLGAYHAFFLLSRLSRISSSNRLGETKDIPGASAGPTGSVSSFPATRIVYACHRVSKGCWKNVRARLMSKRNAPRTQEQASAICDDGMQFLDLYKVLWKMNLRLGLRSLSDRSRRQARHPSVDYAPLGA